jgi:hypothetical protein
MTRICGLARSQYARIAVVALWSASWASAGEPGLVDLRLQPGFDPFSVDAKSWYAEAAIAACRVPKPPGFAGYKWILPRVAAELRRRSGTSEGKQIYIGFLKTKYGYQISKVNAEYGTDAQSFTELQESSLTQVDLSRPAVRVDDAEFDRDARKEMVEGILEALRRCDPDHASGGIRRLLEGVRGF